MLNLKDRPRIYHCRILVFEMGSFRMLLLHRWRFVNYHMKHKLRFGSTGLRLGKRIFDLFHYRLNLKGISHTIYDHSSRMYPGHMRDSLFHYSEVDQKDMCIDPLCYPRSNYLGI